MDDVRARLERSDAVALDPTETAALLTFAGALADVARPAILPHFRVPIEVENKAGRHDYDPVTAADRGAEDAMRALIRSQHPAHGILGEEHGLEPGSTPLTWVLDPLDGTRSFITGMLHWGTLIALYDGRRPVLGVVDQPYTQERFLGCERDARFVANGHERRLGTRLCSDLAQAALYCTQPELFRGSGERAAFDALARRVRLVRYGGDCYSYCMLAHGLVDIVIEAGLAPYDVMALVPIIHAAGGVITDWRGGPAWWGGRVIAAGDPILHAQALELLVDTPD